MTDKPPRNDAAMAEILASIRRIVADEDRRGAQAAAFDVEGDVLILTQEMRIEDDAAAEDDVASPTGDAAPAAAALAPRAKPVSVASPEAALSADEAAVVDIARIVLRDEFDGEFGRNLTAQITQLVRAEVARALAEQGRARD